MQLLSDSHIKLMGRGSPSAARSLKLIFFREMNQKPNLSLEVRSCSLVLAQELHTEAERGGWWWGELVRVGGRKG